MSREGEVGIDIEVCDASPWDLLMEEMFLSDLEREVVVSLDPFLRKQTCLSFWTMKEAYLKKMGWGLLLDLRKIETRNINFIMSLPMEGHMLSLATTREVVLVSRYTNGS